MVRNSFEGIIRFWRLLRRPPPERSHVVASRRMAKRLRGATGMSCSGAYGSGGNSNIDEVLGKELTDGRQER